MAISGVPTLETSLSTESGEHAPWLQQAEPSAAGARYHSGNADQAPMQAPPVAAGVAAHHSPPRPNASFGSSEASYLSTLEEQLNSAYASRETEADSPSLHTSPPARALAAAHTDPLGVRRRFGSERRMAEGSDRGSAPRRHPFRADHPMARPEAEHPRLGSHGAVDETSAHMSSDPGAATDSAGASSGDRDYQSGGSGARGSPPRGPPSSAQQREATPGQEQRRGSAAVVSGGGTSAEAVAAQRSGITATSGGGQSPRTASQASGAGHSPLRLSICHGAPPAVGEDGVQSPAVGEGVGEAGRTTDATSPGEGAPTISTSTDLDGALPRECPLARFAQQRVVHAGHTGSRCCSVQ